MIVILLLIKRFNAPNKSAARLFFCCRQGMGYVCRVQGTYEASTQGRYWGIPIVFSVWELIYSADLFGEETDFILLAVFAVKKVIYSDIETNFQKGS